MRRLAIATGMVALAGLAGPVHGSAATTQGPDYVATDNVQFIKNISLPGVAVGARIIGHYLYMTSTRDMEIYDISTPENPQMVSQLTNAEFGWENEQVPTNGRILGFSQSGTAPIAGGGGCLVTEPGTTSNCLVIWDVTDKSNPKIIQYINGSGDHTSTCILSCTYMWGSAGSVSDLTHIGDPGHPASRISTGSGAGTGWQAGLPGKSCHHQTEVSNGIILAACQPFMLLSVLPKDGGSVLHPKLLATGTSADGRFIHSTLWPNLATDRFALIGGETNFQPECGIVSNGAFMTWDTSTVGKNGRFNQIDEYRVTNGTYTTGGPPVNVLGCSVHWFEEHPSFHNGGLVALAAYESGTRFLQVDAQGKIHEQGWFIPIGRGSTSAPHWAPNSNVLYSIDYERGIDVLKWTGPLYSDRTSGPVSSNGAGTGGGAVAAPSAASGTGLANTGSGSARLSAAVPAAGVALLALAGGRLRRRARPVIA